MNLRLLRPLFCSLAPVFLVEYCCSEVCCIEAVVMLLVDVAVVVVLDVVDRIVDVIVKHRAAFLALCVLSSQQLLIALDQLLLLLRHKNGQVLIT